jgi:hypothetical protein
MTDLCHPARIEVGGPWCKPSYSSDSWNCVEARRPTTSLVQVRDSDDPDGPILTFAAAAWSAFVDGLKEADRG